MNLTTLRQRVKGRYGLPQSATEDALFTDDVLDAIINERHRWLAEEARCYRQTVTKDLAAGSASTGLSTVYTGCNVIVHLDHTVRVLQDGEYQPLTYATEEEIVTAYGPLRGYDLSFPTLFFYRVGTALDQQRVVECFPGASSAVTNGFQIDAYVYPKLLTNDAHAPAMQPAESDALISAVIWGMAELEMNRGTRPDAATLVAYWEKRAKEAARTLRRVTRETKGPSEINAGKFDVMGDW